MSVVPRGAALVLHHRGGYATPEKLTEDRARILDILGPDTRVLLIADPDDVVGVHVVDDGARALVDAALALHQRRQTLPDTGAYCALDSEDWPCRTARALGVES